MNLKINIYNIKSKIQNFSFLKSEFNRSVLTLTSGTAIAQAIPILASPILTRMYSPIDFGIFALYMSITNVIALIATGRYELAIILPKRDYAALNLIVLSIIISFLIAILSFLIVITFNKQITSLLNNVNISAYLYLIPISVVSIGIYQCLNYWCIRKKQYFRLFLRKVIQSLLMVGFNLILGILKLGACGLVFGYVASQGIITVLLGKNIWQEDNVRPDIIKKLKIISLMRKYKKLPLYNLPNALFDGIRMAGIDILLIKFFSSTFLGQFYLAFRILQSPVSLVGASISQVFIKKIATVSICEINNILNKFLIRTSILVLPFFAFFYFFAEDIFVFMFGKQWHMAGQIASIITPWIFLNFLTSPISNVFIVLNKQETMFIFSIFYTAVPLGIIYIFHDQGFSFVLKLISLFMSLLLIIFIALAKYIAKQKKWIK